MTTSFGTQLTPFSFMTAGRVRFGRGMADTAAADVAGIGRRVLLVRGRSVPWVDDFVGQLVDLNCFVSQVFVSGEPSVEDVEAARAKGRAGRVDVVVGAGGGAAMDLAKAAAAMIPVSGQVMDYLEGFGDGRTLAADPLPCVALPTTAGTGSEATKNAVVSVPEVGRKVSLRDDRMVPRLAIIDPGLTDNTPLAITLAAGLDAITQVIEPYISPRANPLTDALCQATIPVGWAALATLADREDPSARDHLAYVSLVGGIALANAGLGAVHGLAGVIGGRFRAPHGLICGRLLGPVLYSNRKAAQAANADLSRYNSISRWVETALGLPESNGFEMLPDWLDMHDLQRLSSWIGKDADLNAIAEEAQAASSMKANPFKLSVNDLTTAMKLAL